MFSTWLLEKTEKADIVLQLAPVIRIVIKRSERLPMVDFCIEKVL